MARRLRFEIREWTSPALPRRCPPDSQAWPGRNKTYIVDALVPATGVSADAFDPVSRRSAVAGARTVCRDGDNAGRPTAAVAGESCSKGSGGYHYFYACTPMSYPLHKRPVRHSRAKTLRRY